MVTHLSTGLAKTAASKAKATITAFVSAGRVLNHATHLLKNCGTYPPLFTQLPRV